MLAERGATLNSKEVWVPANATKLASDLGYVNDGQFQQAVADFKEQFVDPATCTQMLGAFALGFFRAYQPPLTPVEKSIGQRQTPTLNSTTSPSFMR